MPHIAETPEPPYYAVVFTSVRRHHPTDGSDDDGYEATAERMLSLAITQPGFLGVESARDGLGITVSYWADEESIVAWREHAEHVATREQGRERWYEAFTVRVARVERSYDFRRSRRGT